MGSLPDPGGFDGASPPSFDDFQKQASLMTTCTLLWKELSDHFTSLEQDLREKSEAIMQKIKTLDRETKACLTELEQREISIDSTVENALTKVDQSKEAAMIALRKVDDDAGEVDDGEGLLMKLKRYSLKMDSTGFWRFITVRKKELDSMRGQIPAALADCVDPPRFVLEAISEVFPVDKRGEKSERVNDLGWACVVMLESLIPVMVDPVLGNSRLLVTPIMKARAKEMAETWKASLDQRGGIENVKTPDVHTFLQHLVTFGIFKKEDFDLYRKLVVGSAWRKQMPKLALALGLGDKMPDMIEELISRGQQVDAVHFTYEVGLVEKFPPVPLLKAFLKDAKKAVNCILEDQNSTGRSAHLASRKEQSALRAVIKCIEEYKLEAEFPSQDLRKRLELLEKVKTDKKRSPVAASPATKRTRVSSNGGPMPPAKAGRSTNAYVSSFPTPPTYVRSPSHAQYPVGVPSYAYDRPAAPSVYGSRSPSYPYSPEAAPPPYAYSPEAAPPSYAYSPEAAPPSYAYSPEAAPPPLPGSYPGAPINYPTYGGYASPYQQAYYR